MRAARRVAALAALLAAAPAAAQTPADSSVVVGDARIDGTRVRPGRAVFAWEMIRGDQKMPVGTLTDEITLAQEGGRPVLRRVLSLQAMMGSLVDSTTSDARTLAPISERAHQPRRAVALDFDGRRVRGSITPTGGAPTAVDTASPRPAFNPGSWDLVLRALPLAEGLAVRYAVFDVDQPGERWYSARVVGVERPEGTTAEAWKVEMERGATKVTAWIDRSTREVLRVETAMGGGILRQTRQP